MRDIIQFIGAKGSARIEDVFDIFPSKTMEMVREDLRKVVRKGYIRWDERNMIVLTMKGERFYDE